MDLTSALTAFGILAGAFAVFIVLWDALLSPVLGMALRLMLYAAVGGAALFLATRLL
jgi:hypothetical protein